MFLRGFIFILILSSCIHVLSQNLDSQIIINRDRTIAVLDDNEQYDLINAEINRQILDLTKIKSHPSFDHYKTYYLNALLYKVGVSFKNKKIDTYALDLLQAYLNETKNINPEFQYGITYFSAKKIFLIDQNKDSAIALLHKADQINTRIEDTAAREVNFYLLDFLRSEIYQSEFNYRLAKLNLRTALGHAKEADRRYQKEKNKSWGYTSGGLIALISLGVNTNDNSLIEKCFEDLLQIKADYYNKSRSKSIILSFFNPNDLARRHIETNLTPKHIKFILTKLNQYKEYNTDLDILHAAGDYFINNHDLANASIYLRKIEQLTAKDKSEYYHLLKAKIEFTKANYTAFEKSIEDWKSTISPSNDFNCVWESPIKRIQVFRELMEAVDLYTNAYRETNKKFYLAASKDLADQALVGLQSIKNNINTDEDRTALLQKFKEFTDNVLTNYSLLNPQNKIENQQLANTLLNYFETNKSLNLYVNRILNGKASADDVKKKIELIKHISMITSNDHLIESSRNSNRVSNEHVSAEYSKLIPKSLSLSTVSFSSVQQKLTEDQTIIEYFLGPKAIFTLLMDKSSTYLFKTQIDSSFAKNIFRLQTLNEIIPYEFNQHSLEEYQIASNALYNTLLLPLKEHLKTRLTIIPDGILNTIPWNALITEIKLKDYPISWSYLIKDHSVNTQQSLNLYSNIKIDSVIPYAQLFTGYAPYFSNLKYNISETNELSDLFYPSHVVTGTNATAHTFYQNAPGSKIIHIASHAHSGIDENESFIIFSGDTLIPDSLRSLKLNSELIFLSACETGTGKIIEAEGVMSLANAFFESGVKSVISTLWNINDKISKDQVVSIYKKLKAGQAKDEAIRNMQLEYLQLRQNGALAFPFYWASYQIQGMESPIFNSQTSHQLNTAFLIFPVLCIGILSILFFIKRTIKN